MTTPAAPRLFASRALAARIEAAECALLAAGARSARRRAPALDVLEMPLAGGLATWAGEDSPLNKLAGLGFTDPPEEAALEEVEAAFAARGTPLRIELSSLGDPGILAVLTRRGYRPVGFENVLGLPLPPPGGVEEAPGIEVTTTPATELDPWLDVVVKGFSHPDAEGVPSDESFPESVLRSAIGDLAAAEGLVLYSARRAGALAGGASMRLSHEVAQLCGAATLPAHRRRGVQTTLLARRLADAAAAGCDIAVVTTQPGSRSQQNVQKHGFELLYVRAVLLRPFPERTGGGDLRRRDPRAPTSSLGSRQPDSDVRS